LINSKNPENAKEVVVAFAWWKRAETGLCLCSETTEHQIAEQIQKLNNKSR